MQLWARKEAHDFFYKAFGNAHMPSYHCLMAAKKNFIDFVKKVLDFFSDMWHNTFS